MFISLQIPLADSRKLIPEGSYYLKNFESPDVIDLFGKKDDLQEGGSVQKPPFTRAFGSISKREKGGSQYVDWNDEDYFGKANRAVRFKPWLGNNFPLGLDSSKTYIRWVSRRIFRSNVAARLEVDFKLSNFPDNIAEFNKILFDLLDLPVRIPHIDQAGKNCIGCGETQRRLNFVGSAVALRLLYSTTKHGGKPEKWWITAGEPFFVVELDKSYISCLPKEARKVYRFGKNGISVYYYTLSFGENFNRRSIDTWILVYSDGLNSEQCLREIRINLSRYLIERKCLQIILSHIHHNRINFERYALNSQPLQGYLQETFNLVEKGKGLELKRQTREEFFLRVIAHSDSLVHPGVYSTLLQKLKEVRGNLHYQIARVIEKQKTIGAAKNIYISTICEEANMTYAGDSFQDIKDSNIVSRSIVEASFNKVREEFDSDTAKALKIVAAEIEKSGNKEASELFEGFNEELQKPKPKRSVLRNFWNGIVEALPQLASLAEVVVKVSALFA